MAAKLTGLTHKIAIQMHLLAGAVPFVVLAPCGQSGNFWIHPPTCQAYNTGYSAYWKIKRDFTNAENLKRRGKLGDRGVDGIRSVLRI
jgi:hypothetical protein